MASISKFLRNPEPTAKFQLGEVVKVVRYGHLILQSNEDGRLIPKDLAPQAVGKVGVITSVDKMINKYVYDVDGIPGKSAWFEENQLERYYS